VELSRAELNLVSTGATPRRRGELSAGRKAAALAFDALAVGGRPSVLSDDAGRPRLVPPGEWHVSLAHDGLLAAAAVARAPIGIDLIDLRRLAQLTRVVRDRIVTERAVGLVGDFAAHPAPLLLWSAWEALGKQTGGGVLSGPMQALIEPRVDEEGQATASVGNSRLQWWLDDHHFFCLATTRDESGPAVR